MEMGRTAEAKIPLFSVSIKIPYDLRFMDVALGWATGVTELSGGDQNELNSLRLAIEETLNFLISSYSDAEPWEQMRLDFELQTDGMVEISITNAGPPVHLSRIPRYNPHDPSESEMEGLWYFLAQSAVDDLTFKNLGLAGWRAVIQKRLAIGAFEPKSSTLAADTRSDKKLSFVTRRAVPDDAAGLVDLTYDTYRYTYPAEEFYHESKLSQALELGGILSIIVEVDGVIVGNSSFILSGQTPRCAYSCSLMIKRAFRQSRAIIYLLNEVDRFIQSGGMDVDLCYAGMVTTHTGSQKAGAKVGFMPIALLLSVAPLVDFRGMKTASLDRETQLLVVRLTAEPQLPVLYLPVRHHAVMAPLLVQSGLHYRLSDEEAQPEDIESAFTSKEDLIEGSARITTTRMGRDFAQRLQKRLFTLKANGIQTAVILIPAWRPIPPDLDAEMGKMHAIFTGIKPVSAHESYLVYCALSGPVNFELIRLSDPLAVELKNHCEQLFEHLVAE